MHRRIGDLLKGGQPGETAEVRGWVRTRRDSKGGFSFVEINDGSSFASLQAVVPAELPGRYRRCQLPGGCPRSADGDQHVGGVPVTTIRWPVPGSEA